MNFGKNRTAEKSDAIGQAIDAARAAVSEYAEGELRIAEFEAAVNTARESAIVGDGLKIAGQIQDLELMRRDSERKRARAMEVIAGIYRCAAESERGLAEEKRRRRAEILEKIRKPLEELSRIEGVEYSSFILRAMPNGVWEGRFTGAQPDFDTCGPGDVICRGGELNPQPWFIPLSERLSAEVKAHEARAAELAERQVDPGTDLNEALEMVSREVSPPSSQDGGRMTPAQKVAGGDFRSYEDPLSPELQKFPATCGAAAERLGKSECHEIIGTSFSRARNSAQISRSISCHIEPASKTLKHSASARKS